MQKTEDGVYLEHQPDADRRTEAEKRYDEYLLKRESEKVKKLAAKSHREKVKDFNEYLEKLTEHHDIPKVGPG
jgi:protein FAM32A